MHSRKYPFYYYLILLLSLVIAVFIWYWLLTTKSFLWQTVNHTVPQVEVQSHPESTKKSAETIQQKI